MCGADGTSGSDRVRRVVAIHEARGDLDVPNVAGPTRSCGRPIEAHSGGQGDEERPEGGVRHYLVEALALADMPRLVDEIQMHIVPVLFGTGTRMFEDMRHGHRQLEPIEVVDTPHATHIRYRIA